ncbi:armadillo-type protein [Lipomyces tetrasporus]
MADQEEDYSSLPLPDRATHKIWKVRLAAYDEMAKQFTTSPSDNDPCFRPFLSDPAIYKKIVTDSNVAAQEAGITSLVACLQYGGPNACQRLRGTVVTPLAEKGLVSMRAGTKQKTIDALLYFIELDTPDPVVEELIPILSNKLPKLVAGTTMALREIVKSFGTKTVSPKSMVKALPKLFAHSDKNVRAEATNLTVELYKWMGDALKTVLLPDLKPVQQKELEEAFENMKGKAPQQERFLLSQQQAASQGNGLGGGAVEQEEAEDEIDPIDLAEAVDISGKIPADFYERMGSVKWKDRKEAVDDLFKVVSVQRIADADFSELMRGLAKCIAKDANVAVVTVAANCIEAVAKGLRGGYARYKATVFPSLLERLKEKKQSVSEALAAALDAVFQSTTFSDVLEDILEFMKHKNPQVKQETTMFLVRCLRTVKIIPKAGEIKQMCDACTVLLADTSKPVRSAAADAMGTIMKMIGERAMTPYIDGLDDIRKGMIKESFETATVRAKPEKVAPPAAVAPKATAAARSGSGAPRRRTSAAGLKRSTGTPPTSSSRVSAAAEPAAVPPTTSHSRLAPPGARTSRIGAGSTGVARKRTDDHPSSPRMAGTSGTPPRGSSSRGLTGVSLSTSTSSSSSHSGLSAAEKAELAELRRAREEWASTAGSLKQQVESLQADNLKLSQTIEELQLNNKQLIEDHTRDVLAVKAKETQLARARSEVDNARAQIGKLQSDLDSAKNAAAAIQSGAVARAEEIGDRDLNDGIRNMSPVSRTKSENLLPEEEKENGFAASAASRSASIYVSRSSSRAGSFSPISSSTAEGSDTGFGTGNAGSVESWRRAAEVTSQLKARIEAMKARQIRR